MEQALIPIKTIVKNGWTIYTNNYRKFFLPGLLFLPILLFGAYGNRLVALLDIRIPAWSDIIMLALYIIALVPYILGIIVFAKIINNIYLKNTEDKDVYLKAVKVMAPYVLMVILLVLIIIGGTILLIIPGLFFMVWYRYATMAIILEEKGKIKWIKTLSFSKRLSKGRAWDTFGRSFVPTLFVELIVFGIMLILGILSLVLSLNTITIITDTIGLIIVFASLPLFISFDIILYNNLKETRNIKPENTPAQPTPTA